MSTVKTNNVQLGQSVTATNNFTWYQPASPDGTVRLGNGNSGSVTDLVTLTSAGNLGIGTASPPYKFVIVSQANNGFGFYENSDADGAFFRSYRSRGNTSAPAAVQLNDALTGLRGFGYTSAGAYGPRAVAMNFFAAENFTSAAQGTYITFETTPIGSASTIERARLDSSGNLGLGVTPSAWSGIGSAIELKGNAYIASTTQVLSLCTNAYFNGTNFIYKSSSFANRYDTVFGEHRWLTAASGTAGNAITFTQAMTLDASGNLLVGHTSTTGGRVDSETRSGFNEGTADAWKKGAFSGRGGFGGPLSLINTGGASDGFCFYLTGSPSQLNVKFGANAGGVSAGVYMTSTATSWTAASDERLKDITGTISDAVQSVQFLRPVRYTLKADQNKTQRVGLIAQDVQKVLPEVVDVDDKGYLGVRYSEVVPLLVAAIQELSQEIETLKQRIK